MNFLYAFLIIVLLFNVFLILTKRTYLYRGVWTTYLSGRTGPSIYDINIFASRKIAAGKWVKWKVNIKSLAQTLPFIYRKRFKKLKTTGFIVIKDDVIHFERYYRGATHITLSNSFSMAKSVVGIMTGVAIDKGWIENVNDPIQKYLPEFKGAFVDELTVKHCLTMSAGLKWNESGVNPFSLNAKAYFSKNLDDLVFNEIKIETQPGIQFNYQSGTTQILAMVLQKVSGMTLSNFCSQYVWSKIGASQDAFWSLDRKGGTEKSYCCIHASLRDFARLGTLVNHYGKVGDEQIVSSTFIEELRTPAALYDVEYDTENQSYGYSWWLTQYKQYDVVYMRGILGQYIICLPELNIIVGRTGHKRMDKDFKGHPRDVKIYLDAAFHLLNL